MADQTRLQQIYRERLMGGAAIQGGYANGGRRRMRRGGAAIQGGLTIGGAAKDGSRTLTANQIAELARQGIILPPVRQRQSRKFGPERPPGTTRAQEQAMIKYANETEAAKAKRLDRNNKAKLRRQEVERLIALNQYVPVQRRFGPARPPGLRKTRVQDMSKYANETNEERSKRLAKNYNAKLRRQEIAKGTYVPVPRKKKVSEVLLLPALGMPNVAEAMNQMSLGSLPFPSGNMMSQLSGNLPIAQTFPINEADRARGRALGFGYRRRRGGSMAQKAAADRSPWVNFLHQYARRHNIDYGQAMVSPDARREYRRMR